MDPLTLAGISTTLLKAGPAIINTVSHWFDGDKRDTAQTVARLVGEVAVAADPHDALRQSLTQLPPAQILRLQEIADAAETARHRETQLTIRAGDSSEDEFVRRARPLAALLCVIGTLVYVIASQLSGINIDIELVLLLLSPALVYMGLREQGKARGAARTAAQTLVSGSTGGVFGALLPLFGKGK
ncbi:hypothetical protein [Shewanella algae]|uniref:hypothetical protein n=1 Tax=Shewanella algae TaxID=38313 RepID=UPI000F42BE0F|nr:hypothetical protein [Shewanella algae]AYV12976.1 hypothetical protein EEY24_08805 [Shewanella algae]